MKFSSLSEKSEKIYRVRKLDGGINNSELPNNIADNELTKAENMDFCDGVLQTRPGLSATEYDIIKNETESLFEEVSYAVTDVSVFVGGENKRLAYEKAYDGDSHYIYYMYLLGADGSKQAAGVIYFNRISDDSFFTPYSLLFYSGKPVNGGGIFALVTARNQYNSSEYSYKVYEINSALNAWDNTTSFYEPVIMINGRGNNYESAKATNVAYTAQPKFLEARNILTTRFKAYFTSDGHSDTFRLPYSGLASESVMCRIYTSLTDYTDWVIYSNSTSDTQTFYTAKITMHVDRSKGIIYFTGADGKSYPVPTMSMYHENNICVRAGKLFGEEMKEICTLTCCAAYDSKLVFSGGSQRGRIYSVPYSNPLYFSEKSVADIGGGENGITALLNTKDGIIAFKKNEAYKVKIRHGGALNMSSLLADDDSVFYEGDAISQTKLADIGCAGRRACALCGSYPVWLADDGKLYSVNTSSGKISLISAPANNFLSRLSNTEKQNAAAVGENGKFRLLFGSKMLTVDYTAGENQHKFYIWNFDKIKPIDILLNGNERKYVCTGSDGKVLYYAAENDVNSDTNIKSSYSSQPEIESITFTSSFSTKCFDFGVLSVKKHIESIAISSAARGILKIKLTGDTTEEISVCLSENQYNCNSLSIVRLIPHIGAVKMLGLAFSSESGMKIGEISFNYREA